MMAPLKQTLARPREKPPGCSTGDSSSLAQHAKLLAHRRDRSVPQASYGNSVRGVGGSSRATALLAPSWPGRSMARKKPLRITINLAGNQIRGKTPRGFVNEVGSVVQERQSILCHRAQHHARCIMPMRKAGIPMGRLVRSHVL